MELVHTQAVRVTKITDEQRAIVCKESSLPPTKYIQSVDEVRRNPNQQCFDQDPFVAAWNLSVTNNMLTIPARILPTPTVVCNETNKIIHQPSMKRGVWNHSKTEFYQPTKFPKVWALINLSTCMDFEACRQFYVQLKYVAEERGIGCREPVLVENFDAERMSKVEIIGALRMLMIDNPRCEFFLVILPENDRIRDPIYADIKELVR